MEASLDLSIIIVAFNQRKYLIRCLESIEADLSKTELGVETWVVDNASLDGSLEAVEKEFPSVERLKNEENLGFSRANNQAISLARGRYFLLLNNDTEVLPGAIEHLVAFADAHPKAGAVGCTLLDSFGQEHQLPASILSPQYWNRSRPRKVSWLVGACILLRREALEALGGLDEDFFFYYEDVDLGLRLRKAGWQVFFTPDARVIHHEKKSSEIASVKPLTLYHLYRGRLLLARKHYGRAAYHLNRLRIALELRLKKKKWPYSEIDFKELLKSLFTNKSPNKSPKNATLFHPGNSGTIKSNVLGRRQHPD